MLIRFAVENFLSFKDKQVFSMVAAKHTRHPEHITDVGGKRILKGSFLFGANASGKSNFIKAVAAARHIIFSGLSGMDRKYFRLDPSFAARPGSFQFDIYSNGNFYSYGFAFSYSDNMIISEWLYRINGNNEVCIFERLIEDGHTVIHTGAKLNEDNQYRFRIYGEDINNTKTLLQDISEKEIVKDDDFKAFRDVWKWFGELVIIFPDMPLGLNTWRSLVSDNRVYQMVRTFDTGIRSVSIEEQSLDKILSGTPERIRERFFDDVERIIKTGERKGTNIILGDDLYSFELRGNELVAFKQLMDHGNPDELFSFDDESDGTKRLFDLLPFVTAVKESGVILIDEIDRSFHTNLIIRYIELFYDNTKNLNMQLIATLHDVNLMDMDIIRQDEIWFIHRDEITNASDMYSLNRFQIRFDKKVIKDYLIGRFGSVPLFGQMEENNE